METLLLLLAGLALCATAVLWLLGRVLTRVLPGGLITRTLALLLWRRHRRRRR